ncbi:oligosaccharide flippase family protein [Mucilaginibacter flavidus]|uniref:oligosaccharide flippase family protein n=1 Tax=Mucilaginibacter flavidus TaxID=2949309 RepID=UPI0020925068|nr:polysaccharide biosynthesis C-terminal domain-containing protein [Mucilaginibacter flavidus]MCO5949591.1 polysaccharide biosynthesis C-terminal domain-containing protein [Mucilaginibacter flavidus]
MTKHRLLTKIFSSGLQAISVQVLGAFFFYFISVYLSKYDFGVISWTNAVSILITTVLGFGLEQVVVRRVAASRQSDWAATAFFIHSITGFLITFLFLLLLNNIMGTKAGLYKQLPWFFLAQGLIFIGVPLKQFLNAKEKFTPYGVISIISNIGKIAAAWLLLKQGILYINTVLAILICAGVFELVGLLVYLLAKTSFDLKFRFKAYIKLIRESSAQYISVIFDISLSRMDWILLGIMTSTSILADYSFAYRAYELSRLPMLIIAPIILPRFARLLSGNGNINIEYQKYITAFNVVELFFAALIPLILNILWVPVISLITHGKYGSSNSLQFLILSGCIPLQFFINLLWSISFAAKKYKSVSIVTIVCAVTNVCLNLILIPRFGGLGAATAFLGTTLLQALLYYRLVNRQITLISIWPILIFTAEAVGVYFASIQLKINFLLQGLFAVFLYMLITILTRQITRVHINNFKNLLNK